MNTENTAPLSAEDEWAASVAAMKEAPAAEATPDTTPEPQQTQQDARPRDEQGRFAPKTDAAPTTPAAPPEPFEGFSALDPAVQEQFRGILQSRDKALSERNSFRDRFSRANQLAEQLRRQQQPASQGSGRQPQPSQGSGHQAQPALAQARADVATMAPGQQRDNANRQLDAWEKHAREYPEEAQAVQQYVDAFRAEVLAGIAPQLQELGQLREQVNGLRSVAEQFQSERNEQHRRENVAVLDEIAPGWDVLSGWKDEQGNPVAEWKGLHPAMEAWLGGFDPEEKAYKLQQMSNPSPRIAGAVFRDFLTDWEAVNGSGQQTTAPNPAAQRRADAQRDVAPSGAGGIPTPAWRQAMSEEDQYAADMQTLRASGR